MGWSVGRLWVVVALGLGLVACESSADKAQREAAQAEALVYGRAAIRSGDRAKRSAEEVEVIRLKNLRRADTGLRSNIALYTPEAGKTATEFQLKERAAEEKRLAALKPKLEQQIRVVEKQRAALLVLKQETEQAMKTAKPEAELNRDVLGDRLEGVVESLAKAKAVLEPDVGKAD